MSVKDQRDWSNEVSLVKIGSVEVELCMILYGIWWVNLWELSYCYLSHGLLMATSWVSDEMIGCEWVTNNQSEQLRGHAFVVHHQWCQSKCWHHDADILFFVFLDWGWSCAQCVCVPRYSTYRMRYWDPCRILWWCQCPARDSCRLILSTQFYLLNSQTLF